MPALPPIPTATASPSRHPPPVARRGVQNKPHVEQRSNSLRTVAMLHSVEDFEQRTNDELAVKVTELSSELSRMKAAVGHLEAERTSQDVWLKERYGTTLRNWLKGANLI